MTDAKKEPKRELSDIRPSKVSIVDMGANDEIFFIAKGLRMKEDGQPTEIAKAVDSYLSNVVKQSSSLMSMLDIAKKDGDSYRMSSDTTKVLNSILKYVRDAEKKFSSNAKSHSEDSVVISAGARNKMIAMLDVIAAKALSAKEDISGSDEVSGYLVEKFHEISTGFNSIENVYAREKRNGVEESTMNEKIVALLKSETPPKTNVENLKKQAEGAMEKLRDVIETLKVDTNRVDGLWELQWKIGDAISMLIDGAALDAILGPMSEVSDSLGENRDEEETDMSEKKTEKSVEEEAVKSSDSSEAAEKTEKSKKSEEVVVAKAKDAPASTPEDVTPTLDQTFGDKLADTIAAAVSTAVKPISEAVDALQVAVQKQAEQIEKMDNDRAIAKGAGTPDETQGAVDDSVEGSKSAFTGLMPPHLQGRYAHGEKVED